MTSKEQIIERLRLARVHLTTASALIHNCSYDIKPFRVSKFLNVLGKESGQLGIELAVFLGDLKLENHETAWEVRDQPSLRILRVIKKEREGLER